MAVTDQEFRRIVEAVAVLMGWRGDKSRAAMLQGDLPKAQLLLNSIKQGANELERRVGTIADSVTDLEGELSTAMADVATLQGELAALQGEIDGIQEAVDDLAAMQSAAAGVSVGALTATTIGSAPSSADYNKVVTDLGMLRSAVIGVRDAVAG